MASSKNSKLNKNDRLHRPKLWPTLEAVLGLRVSARHPGPSLKSTGIDLEETLLEAAAAAATEPLLPGLLASWVYVHGGHVRTEKLALLARRLLCRDQTASFWLTAIAAFAMSIGQSKWRVVAKVAAEHAVAHQPTDMALLAQALGNESWLAEFGLSLPIGSLRIRGGDVLSDRELAAINEQYRLRLLYGADLRADIHWMLHTGIKTASQASRLLSCSQSAAARLIHDITVATAVAKPA